MSKLGILHLSSIDELRSSSQNWDDLWSRSEILAPTAKAEHVAQWCEHFAPHARFHCLVIVENGKWIAALPLLIKKNAPAPTTATMFLPATALIFSAI